MNKEYFIKNGKTYVRNENNNVKEIINTDNIDELLEQENIVEYIDNKINELEELKSSVDPNVSHIREDIINGIFVIIVPLILGLIFSLIGIPMPTYNTIIGELSSPVHLSLLMAFLSIVRTSYDAIRDYKERKRNKGLINGANLSIKYLQKVKSLEDKKLNTLKKNKNIVESNQDKRIIIPESKRIKEIDNIQVVNYKLGKKFKKYYHDYLNGVLHFTLEKEKDIHNMDLYYDLIEEYGPKLIKNFRHTDMY